MGRVLVGCEYSGTVRDAFAAAGHYAMSCDLRETEKPGNHYKGDIRDVLHSEDEWDLAVFHPVCTYLTNAGVRWLHSEEGRWDKMRDGANFFNMCNRYKRAKRIATENPIPHRYARNIIGNYSQIIHPRHYGHKATKATCLWLTNLPELTATKDMGPVPPADTKEGKEWRFVHLMPPGPNREKERSRFFSGFATAMADQWGPLLDA